MTITNGKYHGGVQGHLHLTHKGTPTLFSQALHQSNPKHGDNQWTDLPMICFGEKRNQEADSGDVAERAHQDKFIAMWELDCVATKEGQNLEDIY